MNDIERVTLIQVLVYHQRLSLGQCVCGWNEWGGSHAEHIVDCYEQELARLPDSA